MINIAKVLRGHFVFVLLFAAFSGLVLYGPGSIGHTYDESADMRVVQCLAQSKDPFACTDMPSQTRLVYYMHATVLLISDNPAAQYLVSYLALAILLISVYFFLLHEKNKSTALLFSLLYVTCVPLLCSGRMLLTHSDSVLTLFNTLAFIQVYYYLKQQTTKHLVWGGIFFGLGVATSLLGIFSAVHLLLLYLLADRSQQSLTRFLKYFFPASLLAFFASTIIYLNPETIGLAIAEALEGHTYPYWNYLGSGHATAPWYFSFVLYAVKLGFPFLLLQTASGFILKTETILLRKWIAASTFFILFFLWLKSGFFHYDAPHHQVHLFPFACISIAFVLNHLRQWMQKKTAFYTFITLLFGSQIFMIARCYPNLLFFGAQYGKVFIGQFYGPASFHGQDMKSFHLEIEQIRKHEPGALFIMQKYGGVRTADMTAFENMDSSLTYKYAVLNHLDIDYLRFDDSQAYRDLLEREYTPIYTYYFPWHTPMLSIYMKTTG